MAAFHDNVSFPQIPVLVMVHWYALICMAVYILMLEHADLTAGERNHSMPGMLNQ